MSLVIKMSYKRVIDEEKKVTLQRWSYALVGMVTMIPIILLTLGQMRKMKREYNEFAFYLLLLVHSGLF